MAQRWVRAEGKQESSLKARRTPWTPLSSYAIRNLTLALVVPGRILTKP